MDKDRNMQDTGAPASSLTGLIAGARLLAKEGGCADNSCPSISLMADGQLLIVVRGLTPAELAAVPGLQPGETAGLLDAGVAYDALKALGG